MNKKLIPWRLQSWMCEVRVAKNRRRLLREVFNARGDYAKLNELIPRAYTAGCAISQIAHAAAAHRLTVLHILGRGGQA